MWIIRFLFLNKDGSQNPEISSNPKLGIRLAQVNDKSGCAGMENPGL
jgi:hypothetical protein